MPAISKTNAMYNFRMADSDTESFHSAVGSLSDREDTNTSCANLKSEEVDEEKEDGTVEENKYESNEMQNKYSDNKSTMSGTFVNRKKQLFQGLSLSEESSECRPISKRRNYDYALVDAHFNPGRKIISTEELKTGNVTSRKTLDSQSPKWRISRCSRMGMGKMSTSKNDNECDKISQKNEMNRFEGEGVQKIRTDIDKKSGIESKGPEQKLISKIINNVDDANKTEKKKWSEGKAIIDHDGWDNWELEYAGKDASGSGIQNENRESPYMLTSDEQNRIIDNSESQVALKTKEVKPNKSFWDWTEFGDMFAAVGEGLTNASSVIESGLGLPTPEELVRSQLVEKSANDSTKEEIANSNIKSYGKLFAGFGANVVTGSLDVLEALGKKTFEKLTVPEQGSEKRRFIFEPERDQNLSEVLRELRENQAEGAAFKTSYITKRELTFIDFFEKFSGMLHLEGLELLSRNYLRKIPPKRRREVDEIFAEDLAITLEEYQDDQQENFLHNFKEILLAIALPYKGSGLTDSYTRCQERLKRLSDSGDQIFELFLECLADFTAQSVQSVHKLGQLLLITATTVKQEPFSELHSLIGRQISFFSNQFAQHISAVDTPSEEIEELVTAVFLAAGDSFSYVQQSFRLLRPLLIL
ncbi:unnamed protein product [Cercopithifilaria johnstoni]|uniref:Uncharacterized protein n=1 Tax=Cercopithifilaria johnstoni TaxID=2874296 RepID=A0A8J2MQ96_9BILA|nr:unnamed protein product [Cercopithifilaria johnstoni]